VISSQGPMGDHRARRDGYLSLLHLPVSQLPTLLQHLRLSLAGRHVPSSRSRTVRTRQARHRTAPSTKATQTARATPGHCILEAPATFHPRRAQAQMCGPGQQPILRATRNRFLRPLTPGARHSRVARRRPQHLPTSGTRQVRVHGQAEKLRLLRPRRACSPIGPMHDGQAGNLLSGPRQRPRPHSRQHLLCDHFPKTLLERRPQRQQHRSPCRPYKATGPLPSQPRPSPTMPLRPSYRVFYRCWRSSTRCRARVATPTLSPIQLLKHCYTPSVLEPTD